MQRAVSHNRTEVGGCNHRLSVCLHQEIFFFKSNAMLIISQLGFSTVIRYKIIVRCNTFASSFPEFGQIFKASVTGQNIATRFFGHG